jgi:hypothetical protein
MERMKIVTFAITLRFPINDSELLRKCEGKIAEVFALEGFDVYGYDVKTTVKDSP